VTSNQGSFEILALPRGPYSITVSFTGFKTWRLKDPDLSVGERKRLSQVLQVGEDWKVVEAPGRVDSNGKGLG
jgi:hypothetical protein